MIYLVKDMGKNRLVVRFTQQESALDYARHLSELGIIHAVYEGDSAPPKWLVYDGTIYVKQTAKK